jgi:cytidine deaminase
MKSNKELIELAKEASLNAHAPYSNFHVGAALEAEDGTVYQGCNVENASYGLTICAERNAVFQAVAKGQKKFKKIAIFTDTDQLFYPCGACRQVLNEFAPDLEIIVSNGKTEFTKTLTELLPDSFSL